MSQGLALAHGGSVTCISALAHHRLPLLEPPAGVHVAVARNRGASPGVILHWSGAAPLRGVAPVPLALVHAARCLPRAEWIAAADAAVARGLDVSEVRANRPARGAEALESMLELVDARSGSLPESLLRVALVEAELPVVPQAELPGVGRVDFLVDGVVVEVDGFAYHSDREQYRVDRRRDRAAHRLGYVVLRYTFEEVVHARARVVAEIAHFCGVAPAAAHAANGA